MPSTIEELKEKIFAKYKKETWETKTIGDIATKIHWGSEVRKWQQVPEGFPAVEWKDINDSLPLQFEECVTFANLELIKVPKYFESGDILICTISRKLEDIGAAVVYSGDKRCLAGDHVVILKTNQNNKFITYVLSTKSTRIQMEQMSQKSTVYDLYPTKIKQIKIPLPPPEIQDKIVEFLDKFVDKGECLEEELKNRGRQYEYYRELIFDRGINEQNWSVKSLDGIAVKIYSGNGVTKSQLVSEGHPAIRFSQIHESSVTIESCTEFVDPFQIKDKRYAENGDLLMSMVGSVSENLGKTCAYLGKEKCLVGNNVGVIKHGQNPKYLSYFLSTKIAKNQMKKLFRDGVVSRLYAKDIKKIKIPIPSLEEQAKVVEILDKLYGIVKDIEGGIPFLIQKNKEQYDFYREIILES